MNISNQWNWNNVKNDFWSEPAEEMYYFLYRWQKLKYKKILDIGCGIGRHSLLFAKNNFEVTALDPAESALDTVNTLSSNENLQIETVKATAKEMPFPDNSYDAIISFHSIYHVYSEDFFKSLEEVYRVLKPGGEFYITLLSKSTYSFTAEECKKVDENVRYKKEEDGSTLPHFFVNYDDIIKYFHKFNLIKVKHVEDFTYNNSSWHYFVHASKPNKQTIHTLTI